MIRVIRKNNETLQIGTLQDRSSMESSAPFAGYEATVVCLRRFMHDAYNMTVLRKVLYADSYQFGIHSLSDQEVISQVARKAVRGQIFIARGKAAQYGGGSSVPSVKEVVPVEGKKWSKKEYVKSFLQESKSTPSVIQPVVEPAVDPIIEPTQAQETNWVAFKVVYDDTDEPVAGVQLKLSLPDGSINNYTTDGAGKIYISSLPDGTCDVQEMLDNDALEVIEILVG